MQDKFQRIKERFDDAHDSFSDQRARMVEDLKFSNPSDPQQWVQKIRLLREAEAMPCYTFDQTNQYVAQVVNDSRMNKPQIQTVPANSGADQQVSDVLDGMIRQIEYASSAPIAYDTAQEHAARVGRGWLRVLPEVVDHEYNLQEIRIRPVIDCLSVIPGVYTLPTGEDMTYGFVESRMSKDAYERKYGKKKGRIPTAWQSTTDGWFDEKQMRIAEYFEIVETKQNNLVVQGPDGSRMPMAEEEYWALAKQIGFKPPVIATFKTTEKTVEWSKLNGDDFIEESTTFPSQWIPLIPVHGYEIWIEGKRDLCGMVRRMMDAQRAYNLERSAYIQMVALQPKAPYVVAWESVEGHRDAWATANNSNQSYLPYDAFTNDGQLLPPPRREAPPNVGSAYAQNAQMAQADLQASVGMYRASLGAPSNETSGVAIKRREQQGDTANFHYIDNLARSMGHLGKIIVDMIPRLYADTEYGPRDVQTLGVEGKSKRIVIDAGMSKPVMQGEDGVVHINPKTGSYAVRVKVGPAYANLREELSTRLSEISRGNPALGAALAPLLTQMMDMPESEKVSKICLALLPPEVRTAYDEDDGTKAIPPKVAAQMQQMQMQGQQMQQMLQQAAQQMQEMQQELKAGMQKEMLKAQTTLKLAELDAQTKAQLAQYQGNAQMGLAQLDSQTKTTIAAANNEAKQDVEELKGMIQMMLAKMEPPEQLEAPESEPEKPDSNVALLEQIAELARIMAAPKLLIRDELGRAAGVQPVLTDA